MVMDFDKLIKVFRNIGIIVLIVNWVFLTLLTFTLVLNFVALMGVNELLLEMMAVSIISIPLAPLILKHIIQEVIRDEQRTKE